MVDSWIEQDEAAAFGRTGVSAGQDLPPGQIVALPLHLGLKRGANPGDDPQQYGIPNGLGPGDIHLS
ncbi:MAG: hypothetical protein P8125_07970 [Gemmatimonadota bacterium]